MLSKVSAVCFKQLLRKTNASSFVSKRNTSLDAWVYRDITKAPPKWQFIVADGLNAVAWWWILVHLWYQFDHIVGEFPYPKPSSWTDEELGVVEDEL